MATELKIKIEMGGGAGNADRQLLLEKACGIASDMTNYSAKERPVDRVTIEAMEGTATVEFLNVGEKSGESAPA